MKQNENILLSTATVKLLTMKELHSVRFMDVVSDFYVEQWLEENTDYAWGIFKNETDELMGYCTIGYADDTSDIIENILNIRMIHFYLVMYISNLNSGIKVMK